ncbi:hypothetical protein AAFF_G00117490 [Aldrovandia affinis]|uniref:Uncharacterized protein n=1 Tax=Aldrovandia affinis TaxID=143900 RepID=A0AAD7WXP8_9TELE|nr:hypothetical protein AAFF_G00117490 [Aldrovandia affinis]
MARLKHGHIKITCKEAVPFSLAVKMDFTAAGGKRAACANEAAVPRVPEMAVSYSGATGWALDGRSAPSQEHTPLRNLWSWGRCGQGRCVTGEKIFPEEKMDVLPAGPPV